MPAARRAPRIAATLSIAALALTACGEGDGGSASVEPEAASTETITVAHAQGETEVPVNPQTVITFDMGVLDTLDTLGVEVAGLPKSNVPEFLSEYDTDGYVNAGTLFEPDYEAVNAAQPDLIIVAGRSAAAYPELEKIAATIDLSTDATDYLGSFTENTTILGEIFEKEAEVADALTDIEESIERVTQITADAGTGLIVLTSGGEVTAYGPGSRFGMLHDVLGVTPAVEDVEAATHGEAVSFEFIREANPDWMFVVDRDAATGEQSAAAEQVLDNELVAATTAWQTDQVVYLDPVRWYIVGSGLSTVQEMIGQIESELS
jgi:iron complex transport system substrate-binding protein